MLKSIKNISKRTVSIILSIMMLVSMMLVGMVTANADAIINMSEVYVAGSFNDWSTSSWKLTAHDSNHYSGSFYIPRSDSNYYFKLYIVGPNWSDYFSANGYWFKSDATIATSLATSKSDDQIQCISSDSGFIKVTFDFYGTYDSNSRLSVTQSAVSSINASISASSTSIKSGETSTLTTSVSGGTGSYNTTYTVKDPSGTDVTNSTLSNNVFTAPSVTSTKVYTVSYTVQDKECTDYSVTKTTNITVNPSNYTGVTAKAQSTANGTTFVDDTSAGTVTIGSSTVSGSTGTAVTATAKTGYIFSKWTSSNGSFTNATSANTTFKPTANNAVAIAQFKKIYNITVNPATNGTVTPSVNSCGAGDSYTITATPDVGYVLGSLTINGSAVSVSSNKYIGKATADVTVTATFVPKSPATVTVSSNNNELGTAEVTPSSDVYVGDTITLTATATNGAFKNWTLSGATYNSGYSSSNSTVQVTVTGNVTAIANFDEKLYSVIINTDDVIPMKETAVEGVFISTVTVGSDPNNNSTSSTYRFTIQGPDGKYARRADEDSTFWFNTSVKQTAELSSSEPWSDSYTSGKRDFVNKTGSAQYVVFDSINNVVYLNTDPDNKRPLNVYVKRGTNRNPTVDLGGALTYHYASESKLIKIDNNSNPSSVAIHYNNTLQYSVTDGNVITIQTTMADDYKNLTYYVAAYCINGKYVEASKANDGVYFANYTISEAEAVYDAFEITPVYYNATIEAQKNYITFYVDSEDVPASWGKTVSVNADYAGGNNPHYTGGYPGQPMMLRGKYYEIKIPKFYYSMSSGTPTVDTTHPVTSVTMNSYHWDLVHYYIEKGTTYNNDNHDSNYQTYDFADFAQLAKKDDVETILFENKYYPSNAKDNNVYYNWTQIDDIQNANVNPWQPFQDYYEKDIDIFGTRLSNSDLTKTKKLYIISIGNFTTNSNYNTNATWATRWRVYNQDGKFLTEGTPADFLDSTKSCYTALSDYAKCQVFISYDKERTNHTTQLDSGQRSDGRWYYSKEGLEFTSNVLIEYFDSANVLHTDTNTNNENTGYIGQVTDGTKATLDGYTVETFDTVSKTVSLDCQVADGWRFIGWYIKSTDSDGNVSYIELSKNTSYNEFIMSNTFTLVARVQQIPEGSLVLSHSQYTGSTPAPHDGTGEYFISATVKDANGNTVSEIIDSKEAISIPTLSDEYTIDIKLRTVCHGDDTFYAWYEADTNGGFFEIAGDEDPRGKQNVEYSFTLKTDMLFQDNKQVVKRLDFYSDIVKISAYCTIEYRYYDRFEVNGAGNMVSYIVRNIELTNEEIENGYVLSRNDVISQYAPEIDTMYVDTAWKIVDMSSDPNGTVDKTKCYVIVKAIQVEKDCKVIAPVRDKDGNYTYTAEKYKVTVDGKEQEKYKFTFEYEENPTIVPFNTWYEDKNGEFILEAPKTIEADGKQFSFARWEVYNLDENGQKTDELVTVLTDRVFTLRIMADYILVPIYEEEISELTTHISAPIYNREVWGEATNPTDRLYVDFLVAFTSTDVPVFKENDPTLSGYTVECGIIVDRNNDLKLSAEDRAAIITAAESGDANPLDMETYKENFGTDYDAIQKVAFDSTIVDRDKSYYTDSNNNEHRLTKYVFTNSQLTNKNRIDKVLVYTNNEANQNYIFAAYTYVILTNTETGEQFKVITSVDDAQFYNLCYKGNEPYKSPTT